MFCSIPILYFLSKSLKNNSERDLVLGGRRFVALLTGAPSQLFFKVFFPQVYSSYIQEALLTEHLFDRTLDDRFTT